MVTEVFNGFWCKLEGFYGKKDQHQDFQKKAEWALRNVPTDKASDVYDYIVFNYEFFPKLPEFRNIAAKFEVIKEAPVTDEKCAYCLGSGLIRYARKVKGLSYDPEYFAACMCSKGRRYRRNPIKGIEDVYGARTNDVLKQLEERNAPRKSVSELQADFVRGLEIIDMRSQSFKKQASSS